MPVIDYTCNCPICLGELTEEQFDANAKKQMEKHGWFAHYVFDDPATPYGVNAHTHGLPMTFKHPDIQIVMPLPPELVHCVFSSAIELIKGGVRFEHLSPSHAGILKSYLVRFIKAQESGRDVLRMILPDKHGCIYPPHMDEDWVRQFELPADDKFFIAGS